MLAEPHTLFEELRAEGVGPRRAAARAAIEYGEALAQVPRIMEWVQRRKREEERRR